MRRGLPRRGEAGLYLGSSPSSRPGARAADGGTHRHGGAPGRREQEAGRWTRLSGRAPRRGDPAAAAAPLGRPPPRLRPFPSPARSRPLPSAHKTFFFFFSNFLGGPERSNGWRGSRDKQRRGPRRANGSAGRAGGGTCRDGTGALGRRDRGAGGWGRREGRAVAAGGRAGPGRGRAGRKEGPSVQVTPSGHGVGAEDAGGRAWHASPRLRFPPRPRSDGSARARRLDLAGLGAKHSVLTTQRVPLAKSRFSSSPQTWEGGLVLLMRKRRLRGVSRFARGRTGRGGIPSE